MRQRKLNNILLKKYSRTISISFVISIMLMLNGTARQDNWSSQTAKTIGANHALIIGIDRNEQFEKIQGPGNDAEALYDLLTTTYHFTTQNTMLLTNKSNNRPTRNNIYDYLGKFLKSSNGNTYSNDNLIVFYFGPSIEDNDGTYWIPIDATKGQTWSMINHQELTNKFFNQMNIKHLLIVTDSFFDHELITPVENKISENDFQFKEWLLEYGQRRSRKVIYSDDTIRSTNKLPDTGIFSRIKHSNGFHGDEFIGKLAKTKQHTYFAAYLIQTLQLNTNSMIDIENLMFDYQDVFQPLYKKIGRKLKRAKIKNSDDQDGIFVFVKKSPKIQNFTVSPDVTEQGKPLTIQVTTDMPVNEVSAFIQKKEISLKGAGRHWSTQITEQKTGNYEIFAEAALDEENTSHKKLTKYKITETCPTITDVNVSPSKGKVGTVFHFSANIDVAAHHVILTFNKRPYNMSGSDTKWFLDLPIESRGTYTISIKAFNSQNISRKSKKLIVSVMDRIINVVSSTVKTKEVFVGKKITIEAKTDYPAQLVNLTINNKNFAMQHVKGENRKKWTAQITLKQPGEMSYSLQAQNAEKELSPIQNFSFLVYNALPEIIDISCNPRRPTENEPFSLVVKTNPTDQVRVRIDNNLYEMTGDGQNWQLEHTLQTVGKKQLEIIAQNFDSKRIDKQTKTLETIEKIYPIASIFSVNISPEKGTISDTYEFIAKTDSHAKKVLLTIHGQTYLMKKSRNAWVYQFQFEQYGDHAFEIVATNKNNVEGKIYSDVLNVPYPSIHIKDIHFSHAPVEGEKVRIHAKASRDAQQVKLSIDSKIFVMKKSDDQWFFDFQTQKSGKLNIAITAFNEEDKPGPESYKTLFIKERPIAVENIIINPSQPLVNETFEVIVQTNDPIQSAELEINYAKYQMIGKDKEWVAKLKFNREIRATGTVSIRKGSQYVQQTIDSFKISRKKLDRPNIVFFDVSPSKGFQEEPFKFIAKTDKPAHKVTIQISGQQFEMKKTGNKWSYKSIFSDYGSMNATVTAFNQDGESGPKNDIHFHVKEKPVNIKKLTVSPETGFSGSKFLFTVQTHKKPKAAFLEILGETFGLNCDQNICKLPVQLIRPGKTTFRVYALNHEDLKGKPKKGTVEIFKPNPDIKSVKILPKQPKYGDTITISVRTHKPVDQITAHIDGQKHKLSRKTNLHYQLTLVPESYGKLPISILAINHDSKMSDKKNTEISIQPPVIEDIEISKIDIKPLGPDNNWFVGKTFSFSIITDIQAEGAEVKIGKKSFITMKGSGKRWHINQKVEQSGKIECIFSAIANGKTTYKKQYIDIQQKPANIVNISVSPQIGYEGDSFVVTVQTDTSAYAVELNINNTRHHLSNKTGNIWETKFPVFKSGMQKIHCYAKNEKDTQGEKVESIFQVLKSLAIPEVSKVLLKPNKDIFIHDTIQIHVNTTAHAKSVQIQIDDEPYEMSGSDKNWHISYPVQIAGKHSYSIIAKNNQDRYGKEKKGTFSSHYHLVQISKIDQKPKTGTSETIFEFHVSTSIPAKKVLMIYNNRNFPLKGNNKHWHIQKLFPNNKGSVKCQFLAYNSEDRSGDTFDHFFTITEITPENRFVDNNDGTITDRKSGLVWAKKPHFTYLRYDDANAICNKMTLGNSSDWRLPTIEEWKSLSDRKNRAPALPTGHPFELNPQLDRNQWKAYWSKSKYKEYRNNVWVFDLRTGKRKKGRKKDEYILWPLYAK